MKHLRPRFALRVPWRADQLKFFCTFANQYNGYCSDDDDKEMDSEERGSAMLSKDDVNRDRGNQRQLLPRCLPNHSLRLLLALRTESKI